MIRLKNLRPAPSTYEIPISAGFGSVRHTVHTIRYSLEPNLANDGPAQGSADLKAAHVEVSRQFPQSLTLMAKGTAGDTSAPLPDGLRHVEPFKSFIAKRQLAVIEVPEEPEPAAEEIPAPDAPKEAPILPAQGSVSGEVSKAPDAPTDVPPAASGTDGSAPADTTTEAPITGRSTNKRGK